MKDWHRASGSSDFAEFFRDANHGKLYPQLVVESIKEQYAVIGGQDEEPKYFTLPDGKTFPLNNMATEAAN